jgi:hypothetical protein
MKDHRQHKTLRVYYSHCQNIENKIKKGELFFLFFPTPDQTAARGRILLIR